MNALSVCPHIQTPVSISFTASLFMCDPERSIGGADPSPGKSQVIWGSIEISNGPPPLEEAGPPPPPLQND